MREPSCHSRVPLREGRHSPAALGGGPQSLPTRVHGLRGPAGREGPPGRHPARRAPAPSHSRSLGPAAPGPPAAPRLRPADPRALRPEGTRGGGPGAGFLGSHFGAAARFILILPPGGGSSPGESDGNWEAARGTGNPSQGWVGKPSTLFCQERARRQPGRCSRGDPAPARLAAEPRPRPPRGAAGAARAEGRGGGSWAARPAAPQLPPAP